MMRSLYTAASGMMAQQMEIENISANLANYSVPGYMATRVDFQELLYAQAGEGTQVGLGVKGAGLQKIYTPYNENFEVTNNPLDLAIQGDGFFQVTLPEGRKVYTRFGSFTLNAQNELVTKHGGKGYSLGVKIPVEITDVKILPDGKVMGCSIKDAQEVVVGNIKIVRFTNPEGLKVVGSNLYEFDSKTAGEIIQDDPGKNSLGLLASGCIAKSNVNVVGEMMSLIQAQKAYEMAQKGVQSTDEMIRTAIQMRRGA